jgi:arsenite methyltransferase
MVPSQPLLGGVLSVLCDVLGLAGLAGGSFLIWASRIGKFHMRDNLMVTQNWRGDEQVLDVGCGSGLLMIGAAKRLTTGKAVGVDIGDRNLEYGSTPENAWANARIEGVADRVQIKDGNACQLPFPDAIFDLVVTSNMLHHISKTERSQAVREMARVLKPGGRLAIAEIAFWRQYIQTMTESGLHDVEEASLNLVVWRSVTGRK